jgi:hypothetical protein
MKFRLTTTDRIKELLELCDEYETEGQYGVDTYVAMAEALPWALKKLQAIAEIVCDSHHDYTTVLDRIHEEIEK